MGYVPYEDFVYSSKYLEGVLLTYLRRRNLVVAPNKPSDRREKMEDKKERGDDKFIGAICKRPYRWKI